MKLIALLFYFLVFVLIAFMLSSPIESLLSRLFALFKTSTKRSIYAIDHIGHYSMDQLNSMDLLLHRHYRTPILWPINSINKDSKVVGFKRKLKNLEKSLLHWEAESLETLKQYKKHWSNHVFGKGVHLSDAIGHKWYNRILKIFEPLTSTYEGFNSYSFGRNKLLADANDFKNRIFELEKDIKKTKKAIIARIEASIKEL